MGSPHPSYQSDRLQVDTWLWAPVYTGRCSDRHCWNIASECTSDERLSTMSQCRESFLAQNRSLQRVLAELLARWSLNSHTYSCLHLSASECCKHSQLQWSPARIEFRSSCRRTRAQSMSRTALKQCNYTGRCHLKMDRLPDLSLDRGCHTEMRSSADTERASSRFLPKPKWLQAQSKAWRR